MTSPQLRIGVVGLGRAFTIMLPTFLNDPRVRLVGATDPIAGARAQFASDFKAPAYDSIEQLCAATDIDVVYVATPHQMHADHVCLVAASGKNVLVEKPMAIDVDDCTRMIEAARAAGVQLMVGPSHSYDSPVRRARQIIDSGRLGDVKMINAMQYTDFLYRPRRPEELDTRLGGGVVHSQAAHQIDVVRLLGGGLVKTLRAQTGAWDPARPTEGAYSALLGFEGGAFCTATYSGYAHYDSQFLMDDTGESGEYKSPDDYGATRKRLAAGMQNAESALQEARLKAQRNYGGATYQPPGPLGTRYGNQNFGYVLVACEKGDMRLTAKGIEIYTDDRIEFEEVPPPRVPRQEVIDELVATLVDGKPPVHTGEWGRATTEACLAILESARTGADCALKFQVPVAGGH